MNAAPWLATLRAFAQEPGALLYPLPTASGRAVPIFADEIRAAGDDDAALLALVARCCGAASNQGEQTASIAAMLPGRSSV